jgi:hypothetical protein
MGGLKIGENVSVSPVYWVQETRGGERTRSRAAITSKRSLRTIPEFVERKTCAVRRAGGCPSIPGGLRRIFEV